MPKMNDEFIFRAVYEIGERFVVHRGVEYFFSFFSLLFLPLGSEAQQGLGESLLSCIAGLAVLLVQGNGVVFW